MFEFRIIVCADGSEIIDESLRTPYESLTCDQMMEYMKVDEQISILKQMERKSKREAERERKLAKNPLYRLACFFWGIA